MHRFDVNFFMGKMYTCISIGQNIIVMFKAKQPEADFVSLCSKRAKQKKNIECISFRYRVFSCCFDRFVMKTLMSEVSSQKSFVAFFQSFPLEEFVFEFERVDTIIFRSSRKQQSHEKLFQLFHHLQFVRNFPQTCAF